MHGGHFELGGALGTHTRVYDEVNCEFESWVLSCYVGGGRGGGKVARGGACLPKTVAFKRANERKRIWYQRG